MINKFSLGDIWLSSTMSAWKEQGQRFRKSNQGELFGRVSFALELLR